MKRIILITGTSAKLYEDDINRIENNTIYTNDGDSFELEFDRYIDITGRKLTCKDLADNNIITISDEMYKLF